MNYPDDFVNKVIQGDCLEVMKGIPDKSVDLVLTDPPYGVTALDWDKEVEWLAEALRISNVAVFFAIQPYASKLISNFRRLFRHEWIWVKNTSTGMMLAGKVPMRRHENILVFGKIKTFNPQKVLGSLVSQNHSQKGYSYKNKDSKLYNVSGGKKFIWNKYVNPHSVLPCDSVGNRDKNKKHPTQKPIALLEYLIKTYSNENDTILDPFLGSGTTAVACKTLKRNFIGIEISPEYCKIAEERLRQETLL